MNEPIETRSELVSRLDLIESMMTEGRRTTEYWGWVFVLWGAAYLIAIGWSFAPATQQFAWPVTMIVAGVFTAVLAIRKRRTARKNSPLGRAIGGIWAGVGISLFIFCFAAATAGQAQAHAYFAAILIFIGAANCASSMALRWRMQFLVALLWWVSGILVCFVSLYWIIVIVLIDAFFGFLGFGIYLMVRERRDRRRLQHA